MTFFYDVLCCKKTCRKSRVRDEIIILATLITIRYTKHMNFRLFNAFTVLYKCFVMPVEKTLF